MKKKGNEYAEAVIDKGCIVIKLSLKKLPVVVRTGCEIMAIDGDWEVEDVKKFAQEVIRELNDGDEDGTTLVHKMFDAAFNQVIENGGEGIVSADESDES